MLEKIKKFFKRRSVSQNRLKRIYSSDQILWADYCDRNGYERENSITYTSSEYFAAVADAIEILRKSKSTTEALVLEELLNFSNVGGEEMNNGIIKAEERYFEIVRSC